jgi:hypothetical protein
VEESELDPWTLFLNAMRAPMTKDRYQTRVAKFFDFIGIPGKTIEQKARNFAKKGKRDTDWALSKILKFVYCQRERVEKKLSLLEAKLDSLIYINKGQPPQLT